MSVRDDVDLAIAKLGGDNGSLEEEDLPSLARSLSVALECLSDGEWHSTRELTRFGIDRNVRDIMRRVRQLRECYQIEKQKNDGEHWYRCIEANREVVVPQPSELRKMQDAYYASEHWRDVRRRRLEFDRWMCTLCGAEEELHVHHWFYHLFAEGITDVQTFCKKCHERLHLESSVVRKSAFPKQIPKDVAEALGYQVGNGLNDASPEPSAPTQPGQQCEFWNDEELW